MIQFGAAIITGVASGFAIFLVAAGVTLIFGVMKVLNFAHGAFLMLGAYLTYTLIGTAPGVMALVFGSIAAGLLVAAAGFVTDRLVLRKLRSVDEHYALIATFALLLAVTGAIKLVWGLEYTIVTPPDILAGAWRFLGIFVPHYTVFIIACGLVTFLILDLTIHRSPVGKLVRSVVSDSWMVGLLAYNVPLIYTSAVVFSFFLAGLAGGLLLPNQTLSPALGENYLLMGFLAVIVGGLGNVRGALVAALLLGVADALSTTYSGSFPGLAPYVVMVVVLVLKPGGLTGRSEGGTVPSGGLFGLRSRAMARMQAPSPRSNEGDLDGPVEPRLRTNRITGMSVGLCALLLLAALSVPAWADRGLMFVVGLGLVNMLFAVSWHFLSGYAGITSFGHAAFFAIGSYLVGYLLKFTDVNFLVALLLAAAAGGMAALAVGMLALQRATGVYFAILTMALAEICRIAISYSSALGGDDGLSGLARPSIGVGAFSLSLASDDAYYWFLMGAVALVSAAIWWLANCQYGRTIVAIRQDPDRAAFLGIGVSGYRLSAFVVSGASAAFAGALMAPWAQIVTPEVAGLMHSTTPILNTLLGGANSFFGPIVGTAAFTFISHATRNLAGLSEVVTGVVLLVVVLAAPGGLIGAWQRFERLVGWRKSEDDRTTSIVSAEKATA